MGVRDALSVKVRSANENRTIDSIRSQAVVISPPMNTQSGLRALITVARPNPRYFAVVFTADIAFPSPERARATKSSTVNECPLASTNGFGGTLDKSRPKYRESVAMLET